MLKLPVAGGRAGALQLGVSVGGGGGVGRLGWRRRLLSAAVRVARVVAPDVLGGVGRAAEEASPEGRGGALREVGLRVRAAAFETLAIGAPGEHSFPSLVNPCGAVSAIRAALATRFFPLSLLSGVGGRRRASGEG